MTDNEIASLADQLVQARREVVALPLPAGLTKIDAMRVKRALLQRLSDGGRHAPVAWKVSMSMTWGALFEGDVLPAGAILGRADFFDPLIETELVFRLREPVSAAMDIADIVARSDVAAAIEIADCRWQGWCPGDTARFIRPTREVLEADNAFAAKLVMGERWVDAAALNLPATRINAVRDGRIVAGGTLDHVMGHPAKAVHWLVQEMAAMGQTLGAGVLIATGNPYRELVTLPRGEQAVFESIVANVGAARVRFV